MYQVQVYDALTVLYSSNQPNNVHQANNRHSYYQAQKFEHNNDRLGLDFLNNNAVWQPFAPS